jgi:uncharacterized protein (TIGR00369 family)
MAIREIAHPFLDMEGFNCFACCPENKHGLRMKFYADEEVGEVFSRVKPVVEHAGYPGVLHGGIQATLLDEVAFWAIWDKIGKPALTSRMEIEFKRPVSMSSEVEARARVTEVRRKLAIVDTWLTVDAQIKTRARVVYFLADADKWRGVSGNKVAEAAER